MVHALTVVFSDRTLRASHLPNVIRTERCYIRKGHYTFYETHTKNDESMVSPSRFIISTIVNKLNMIYRFTYVGYILFNIEI